MKSGEVVNNEIILHISHPKLALNHAKFWIKILQLANKNISVLFRKEIYYTEALKIFQNINIYYANTSEDINLILKQHIYLKVVLHSTNNWKNLTLLNQNNLKNIFIGTKNSDILSHINQSYKAYDEIWVSSQFMLDKYRFFLNNDNHIKYSIIGKPHLKELFIIDEKVSPNLTFAYISEKINFNLYMKINDLIFETSYKCFMKINELKKYSLVEENKKIDLKKKIDFNSIDFLIIENNQLESDFLYELLLYNVPILVYGERRSDILALNLVYTFQSYIELITIVNNLNKYDITKPYRENAIQYLFGKNETLTDRYVNKLNVEVDNQILKESSLYKTSFELKKYFINNRKIDKLDNEILNSILFQNIKTFDFTHIIHSEKAGNILSHLDLWIPSFNQSNVKFMVLTRHKTGFNILKKKYPELSIIYCAKDNDLFFLLSKFYKLEAIFYPAIVAKNMHTLHFNNLKHIFIGYGDSDKAGSAHKYFRVFDENWVASEAHIDRFKNQGFDFSGIQKVKVGRPTLKNIITSSQIKWQNRFNGKLNLLYLSTWEGFSRSRNYSSLYIINNIFHSLKKAHYIDSISAKFHPKTGSIDSNLKNIRNDMFDLSKDNFSFMIYDKNIPIETLVEKSNVFICDISGVITECLATNSPIFVYIPLNKKIELSQSKMKYEDYCYSFSSENELLDKMYDVIINKNDYLSSKREEAMEYVLGKTNTLNDAFIHQLQKV